MVGSSVGLSVRTLLGDIGDREGDSVDVPLGSEVEEKLGDSVIESEGETLGDVVLGSEVGFRLGVSDVGGTLGDDEIGLSVGK